MDPQLQSLSPDTSPPIRHTPIRHPRASGDLGGEAALGNLGLWQNREYKGSGDIGADNALEIPARARSDVSGMTGV